MHLASLINRASAMAVRQRAPYHGAPITDPHHGVETHTMMINGSTERTWEELDAAPEFLDDPKKTGDEVSDDELDDVSGGGEGDDAPPPAEKPAP